MRTNKLEASDLLGFGLSPMISALTEWAVDESLNGDSGKGDSQEFESGPFTGRGCKARIAKAIEEVKHLAQVVIAEQDRMDFGHGFLWGVVAGKRLLIACIDGRANHNEIERRVTEHPAVRSTWINLD